MVILLYPQYSDFLRRYILPDEEIDVVDVGAFRFASFGVLLRTITNLRRVNWSCIRHSSGWLLPLLKQIYEMHLLAIIQQARPAAVISFIDDSGVFHRLSRLATDIPFIAIQNGGRDLWNTRDALPSPPHPGSIISMPHFCCFGLDDVEMFRGDKHQIDNYHVFGSVELSAYEKVRSVPASPDFDILVCSQWHEAFFDGSDIGDSPAATRDATVRMYEHLARMISEESLRVNVIMRGLSAEEERYFRSLFGDAVTLTPNDRTDFVALREMDRARLFLCCNSTLWWYSVGLGNKALWYNPFSSKYVKTRENIWYCEGSGYDDFKAAVLGLLDMPASEYNRITDSDKMRVIQHDPSKPAHIAVRDLIRQLADQDAARDQR